MAHWRDRLESALDVNRDEAGVFLSDARSTDNHLRATGCARD